MEAVRFPVWACHHRGAKTILQGARLTSLNYPNNLRPLNEADVKDWVSHFESRRWLPGLFGYLCDEPPAGCAWDDLGKFGKALRAASPKMKILVTTSISRAQQGGVLDQIDILAPVLDYIQPKKAPSARNDYDDWLKQPGKQLWWYQSCD